MSLDCSKLTSVSESLSDRKLTWCRLVLRRMRDLYDITDVSQLAQSLQNTASSAKGYLAKTAERLDL